jgi:hypothetical protein
MKMCDFRQQFLPAAPNAHPESKPLKLHAYSFIVPLGFILSAITPLNHPSM